MFDAEVGAERVKELPAVLILFCRQKLQVGARSLK